VQLLLCLLGCVWSDFVVGTPVLLLLLLLLLINDC
jgi:hypothetical protein